MIPLLARLGSDLLHLVAPALCPACNGLLRAEEKTWCDACRASLEPAPFPSDLLLELIGLFPPDEIALDAVGALYSFRRDGPVQEIVHALKYGGAYRLGVELGAELGRGLGMFPEFDDIDIIVPIPLHSARRRERGYNQSEAIGRGVARALQRPIETGAVVRRSNTRSQTRLGAEARVANVAAAFKGIRRRIAGARVLLCDDVLTTGSTLNACADALLCAGARSVVAGCLARDISVSRTPDSRLGLLFG